MSDIQASKPKQEWLSDIGYYDDENVQKMRCLLYGSAGAGKTQLASTFPGAVFLDMDKGGLTLRKLHTPFIKCYESKGIIRRVFDILDSAMGHKGPFAPDGQFATCETIVFDSFSVFSDSALADLLHAIGKNPLNDKPGYDEYGKLKNIQIELGKRFKRLSQDYNVVVTALSDVNKDELTGAMTGGPLLVGAYRGLIGADFDEVYYLTTEGVKDSAKHVLYTSKVQFYDAKTRIGMPYRIEDPSYEKIKAGMK